LSVIIKDCHCEPPKVEKQSFFRSKSTHNPAPVTPKEPHRGESVTV